MSNVFLNYRRQDSGPSVGRLYDKLISHFGAEAVFRDLDTLAAGAEFAHVIRERIRDCEAFVVIIGNQWLTLTDSSGKRRLDDTNDLLKAEIVEALVQRKVIIPVLLDGAQMPVRTQLPPEIAALAERNAVEISERRFAYDVDQLIRALEGKDVQKKKDVQKSWWDWLHNTENQRTLAFIFSALTGVVTAGWTAWPYVYPKFKAEPVPQLADNPALSVSVGYQQGFDETLSIAKEVLTYDADARDSLSKLLPSSAGRDGGTPHGATNTVGLPYPTQFAPPLSAATATKPDDLAVRPQALVTIARYNDTLLALAEGKSVAQVKASANGFASSLERLQGVLGNPSFGKPSTSTDTYVLRVKTVLGIVESAHTRGEFIEAIRQGEPLVRQMLDIFIEDTRDFYGVQHALIDYQVVHLKMAIQDNREDMQTLARAHLAPTDPYQAKELRELEDSVAANLSAIGFTGTKFQLLPSGADASPYSELVATQLKQLNATIESKVNAHNALVTKLNIYWGLLSNYVRLLEQTKQNLTLVRAAIDAPQPIYPQTQEVLLLVGEIRREFRKLRGYIQ